MSEKNTAEKGTMNHGNWALPAVLGAAMVLSTAAFGAMHDHDDDDHGGGHHHHSDIEFGFGSMIDIEFAPGMRVFEGDFMAELVAGTTDDPGFNNDDVSEKMGAGSLLGFNVTGPLVFWDGTAFGDAGGASISIEDSVAGTTVVDKWTTSDLAAFDSPLQNIIDQADAFGGIHTHVDFVLDNGMTGAYGLMLSLSTDQAGVGDSLPFAILFNNGLDEVAFEAGVDALNATVVPLPAAAWLFLGAIGLMGARLRKRTV